MLRFPTDVFFQRRYGCRAMMLETVAAVPGMVGGMLLHCKSLRRFEHSGGWIKVLLEEAENERMHLMTFMEVAKPNWYELALVFTVQGVFFNAYFLAYLVSPKLAHRVVGYLEEEAIHSYTEFLKELDKGNIENVPAPAIAIELAHAAPPPSPEFLKELDKGNIENVPAPAIAIELANAPTPPTLQDVVDSSLSSELMRPITTTLITLHRTSITKDKS